jgi:hypothetical protein
VQSNHLTVHLRFHQAALAGDHQIVRTFAHMCLPFVAFTISRSALQDKRSFAVAMGSILAIGC